MSKDTNKTTKLSTEAYKGVRDFYPEDMFIQNFIFSKMRKVCESFGYNQYDASVLEPAELYRAKSGEEIVNEQTYTFTDRGGREVTLRPEMTPTVARMVSARKQELSFPLRWYSIPNLFRYEKPQKGRLREHWQLNVDLFGVNGISADVEVITLAYNLMKSFGAKDGDFEIQINSRVLLNDLDPKAVKLLDKKDKLPKDEFEKGWKEITGDSYNPNTEPNTEIKTLLQKLAQLGVNNAHYDPAIVRGFDYYTGIVFEIYDTNPANRRALFGGGRYDNLTELFGGDPIPAVGFGMGDVTIRDWLETRNLLPEYQPKTNLFICTLNKDFQEYGNELAQKLREKGVNVAVNLTEKKVGDQIKSADKQNIPYIICIGENEVKSGEFKLKNLKTGEEKAVNDSSLAESLK